MPVAIQQAEALEARARHDVDVVSGRSGFHQQSGRASCSISGNLTSAAVRIPQLNRRRLTLIGVGDQNPAVGAGAGMAIADRASQRGRIAHLHGQLVTPGEQEIVARSVRFRKRDLHLFAMVDFHHRRSFHHNLLPQDVASFL